MENQQIAKIFEEIGELLELKGENVFRVRAYHRAAQNIDGLSKDVAALSEEELEAIPGIGKDLAAKIREYATTGKVAKHEALKTEFPAGVLELLRVPGLGPKTVKMFYQERNITGVDELEALARAGKLAGLPGIQKKTEENILKGIELVRRGSERRPLGRVRPLAEEIVGQIRETSPVDRVEVAGSIRRWKETVNDIDILATSRQPEKVMDAFVKLPQVSRVLMHGTDKIIDRHRRGYPGRPARGGRGLLRGRPPVFHRRQAAQHQAPRDGGAGRPQDQRVRRVPGTG